MAASHLPLQPQLGCDTRPEANRVLGFRRTCGEVVADRGPPYQFKACFVPYMVLPTHAPC